MKNKKINIIIFSESLPFISLLKENLIDDEININVCIDNLKKFNKYSEHDNNSIVVIHAFAAGMEIVNQMIDCIERKNMVFIAICENATIGFEMMRRGALGIVIKREFANEYEQKNFFKSLVVKIKDANEMRYLDDERKVKKEITVNSQKIIVIGSSTGGTEAVLKVLSMLPECVPPILIVQHMPPVFTKMYADRLNEVCKMTVWEGKNNDKLKPGLAIVAPGDYQMRLIKKSDGLYVECYKAEKVNGHAPSVDVLFNSVAQTVGKNAIGVILTGMGADGAKGILNMKNKGAYTIGQDEKSCVVYGMPKVAYDIGGVVKQASIENIANIIMENI